MSLSSALFQQPDPSPAARFVRDAVPTPILVASPPRDTDALVLVRQEHDLIRQLFKDFESLLMQGHDTRHRAERAAVVSRICSELSMHIQVEDGIFYPAVRAAIQDDLLMDVADVEHEGVMRLIVELDMMSAEAALYDAKVIVLGKEVGRHMKEEQDVVFPKVRQMNLDTIALGREMASLRRALRRDPAQPLFQHEHEGST
jgi:iron-sulfur cluster repair protein YtfE (RIC family)